jgi:transposase
VLYAAEGLGNHEIAARLDTPRQVVSKWRKRFFDQRLAGLTDLPRGGPFESKFTQDDLSALLERIAAHEDAALTPAA